VTQIISSAEAIEAALIRSTGAPWPLLVVTDFDGTLAEGSRDPGAARVDPVAQRALRRLARFGAERPGRLHLAVLTGRTVADVARRVRVGGIEYLGDHGLQSATLERHGRPARLIGRSDPALERHHAVAETLAVGVARELATEPWLFVERKGASVAFHVRQADDVPAARARVLAAVATVERQAALGDHGLEPYRGRSVVDLRPRGAGGKHEAVARLLARTGAGGVLVLGDELSDVDAFEAVIEARASAHRVGVTVAVHGTRPAPAELLERADLALGSARAVGRLLSDLARHLGAR